MFIIANLIPLPNDNCYYFNSTKEGRVTKIPQPGTPVRGSKNGAPVMALLDLLGRRWSMGVLWTLCEGGPATFRDLQKRCETISPAVLNTRLKELREARLVIHTGSGYLATDLGQELYAHLTPLGAWAKLWAKALKR